MGPPRSSNCRESSSVKAWFLNRRPGVNPHSGLSAGLATSTSCVISANRMTCYKNTTLGCYAWPKGSIHKQVEQYFLHKAFCNPTSTEIAHLPFYLGIWHTTLRKPDYFMGPHPQEPPISREGCLMCKTSIRGPSLDPVLFMKSGR